VSTASPFRQVRPGATEFSRTRISREWNEQTPVHEYVRACLCAASKTMLSTVGLALSLFLPRVAFPGIDTDYAAMPA